MSADSDALFEIDQYDHWRDLWIDMPAFSSADESPFDSINVQFSNAEDRRRFLTLMGERPDRRKSIWFPSIDYLRMSDRDAPPTSVGQTRYPIYVISKGRAACGLTAKALDKLGIVYRLVVEPQEVDDYAEHVNPSYILPTPFSNLGQGSIPARNFVWDHATALGARRHWILDDNMDGFYRLNNNLKYRVVNENPFHSIEDWVDRYKNVPMAGMQYQWFAPRRERHSPIKLNTRIYSCILLTNELGDTFRWRGRYNEDTDLSIRFLKAGYVTALFYHYLCQKTPTMTMTGGNTDELYQADGRLLMAESLAEQHPDVARVSEKWGRPQHHVDYSGFAHNRLIPVEVPA